MIIEKVYNAGIYVRLSNDDERTGESVSIENQKHLLQKYVKEQGWNEIDVYCDDGYSGTNFNRPGVQRLIEDAKSGKINVIIVKDLSRFGRNYIEIGQFTDYLFPSIGCRFIALNNGIDTLNSSGNDMMGFLNLFNEFYSRDTSKKVKSVKKACAENGKYLGTYAPYGYRKDPDNKHHLLIDEDYAPIVRRIFNLRCEGKGFRAIACMLNEESIAPPGVVYYQKKGLSDPRRVNHKWAETTVKVILRNEVYIGSMVQGKTGTLSYKSKKLVNKPREEWIRVENTHEAIISEKVWEIVRELDRKRYQKRENPKNAASIFTGLVHCAGCGFKMTYQRENGTRKDGSEYHYNSFVCGNYRRSGTSSCTPHRIYENALTQLVIADIREKAQAVEHDEGAIIAEIARLKNNESRSRLSSYERELRASTARAAEVENLMQNLYEDRIKGTIPEAVFTTLMQKYETERAEKVAALPALRDKIQNGRQGFSDGKAWTKLIRGYTRLETLDETVLLELVDRIEIGESQKIGGKRVCDIKIRYRYVGDVDEAVATTVKHGEVQYGEAV